MNVEVSLVAHIRISVKDLGLYFHQFDFRITHLGEEDVAAQLAAVTGIPCTEQVNLVMHGTHRHHYQVDAVKRIQLL